MWGDSDSQNSAGGTGGGVPGTGSRAGTKDWLHGYSWLMVLVVAVSSSVLPKMRILTRECLATW